jgi:hypothetical protein
LCTNAVHNEEPTPCNRHPTTTNQPQTPTATSDNQQPATIPDNQQQITITDRYAQQPKPTPDNHAALNNRQEENTARQVWKQQPLQGLHTSFVTNLKPTTIDRQRHSIFFVDNPTFSFTNSTTTRRQEHFYPPIDNAMTLSMPIDKFLVWNMSNSRRFCRILFTGMDVR